MKGKSIRVLTNGENSNVCRLAKTKEMEEAERKKDRMKGLKLSG